MSYFDGHDRGCKPRSNPCFRCQMREKLSEEELGALERRIAGFGLDLDFDFSKILDAKITDFPLNDQMKGLLEEYRITTFGDLAEKLTKGTAKGLRELEDAGFGKIISGLTSIKDGLEKLREKRQGGDPPPGS